MNRLIDLQIALYASEDADDLTTSTCHLQVAVVPDGALVLVYGAWVKGGRVNLNLLMIDKRNPPLVEAAVKATPRGPLNIEGNTALRFAATEAVAAMSDEELMMLAASVKEGYMPLFLRYRDLTALNGMREKLLSAFTQQGVDLKALVRGDG